MQHMQYLPDLGEVDANFMLKKYPGVFCIGEMLDWDAPTGGFLIQACASMAFVLRDYLVQD
jgi:predicted flavoprotein YhiN